ncbi:hypothetical protein ACT453_03285, partial [Bacillus sp. D-CC]
MVVVGKAVDYYRTYLFLLHDDAYHLVYGRTRKYVMKKCGRVTHNNHFTLSNKNKDIQNNMK